MLQAWNEAPIKSSHGIRVDPDGNVWLIDVAGHKVLKMSPHGKLLMVLGSRGRRDRDQNAKTPSTGPPTSASRPMAASSLPMAMGTPAL